MFKFIFISSISLMLVGCMQNTYSSKDMIQRAYESCNHHDGLKGISVEISTFKVYQTVTAHCGNGFDIISYKDFTVIKGK